MRKVTQCSNLIEKIENDTAAKMVRGKIVFPSVGIKIKNVKLINTGDPDSKPVAVEMEQSYDNRNWESFTYFISAEGEPVSDKNAMGYVRKHLVEIAKALEKKGIVNVKYPDDKYVFHRKEE